MPKLNEVMFNESDPIKENLALKAEASGSDFSNVAGPLRLKGISVKKSFFCSNLIVVPMQVEQPVGYNIKVTLFLTTFKVQPFLVAETGPFSNPKFSNPHFCK